MEIGIARLTGIVWLAYVGTSLAGGVLKILPLSLAANAVYIVVAVAVYRYFASAEPLLAFAVIPLAIIGCVIQSVGQIQDDRDIQRLALVFFGLFLAVIGYLLLRAGIAPRAIGYALVAGVGMFTLAVPLIPTPLSAVFFGVGSLGEGAFMLWLLIANVP